MKLIQEVMGHADVSTTFDIYAEFSKKKKKEAMITFAMLILGNEISVQIMIFVSCVLAIILVILLAVSDVLIVKENNRKIDELLAVPEKSDEIIGQEDFWSTFVDEYEFTDRECDVLEELIHTESNLQEISDKLCISKRVVQRHITSIYEKTSCSTRIGLLQLYVEFIRKKQEKLNKYAGWRHDDLPIL